MKQDTAVEMKKPKSFVDDFLTAIARQGARDILAKAIKINNFISQYIGLKDGQGNQRITRNGSLPKRDIQTGVSPVIVKVPRACSFLDQPVENSLDRRIRTVAKKRPFRMKK